MITNPPTVAGFQDFVTNIMGIPTTALAVGAPVIAMAFQIASDLVNTDINSAIPDLYTLAVYNLAASNLLTYAPDISTSPVDGEGLPYFASIRKKWGMQSFSPGIVQSTTDNSSSTSMALPTFVEGLTLADMQLLKDPYGRQYLAIAQKYGSSLWGCS